MKKLSLLLSVAAFMLYACGGECPMKKALEETTVELENTKAELTFLKNANEGRLVHAVHLKTRPDLSEDEIVDLKTKMNSLSTIEGVMNLEIGEPAETNDPRLWSDYNYVLQMRFASKDDLDIYQKNEFHLKTRKDTKSYLVGSPVVFDYWLVRN